MILRPGPIRVLKGLSIFLFLLIIASGLYGQNSPTKNFAPIFIWVIWWVGMAYVVALLGNLWDLLNPWRNLYALGEQFFQTLRRPRLVYPEKFGVWPAVLLFFIFACLEIISEAGESPDSLTWLILIYTVITLIGMKIYGRDTWLYKGEAFAVVFGLLSRFGLFRGDYQQRSLILRPIGTGLHNSQPVSISMMAFVLLMLTTVSFDGFVETPLWSSIIDFVAQSQNLRSMLLTAQGYGVDLLQLTKFFALILLYAVFWIVYLCFCYCIAILSNNNSSTLHVAQLYILSLIPIAIAYHLSHYLSYLLLAGQLIIPLLSDPFGFGWDLFGTTSYSIDISVINAKNVWYLSVVSIVVGHIISVYLAHATAIHELKNPRQAIISQLPMLVLMVSYTMLSLWILSQPIVNVD